jgi:CubicO group peptidase (beta-lactamase class C family)
MLLLLLVIQTTPGMAGSEIVRGELGEELDEYMIQLSSLGYSGALLVSKDGDVVLSKGYGMADREREIPFTSQTVFTIGSIAKQFTAAAVLKLEMMGKLSVDDAITRYFENVPEDKAGITLHHLLTHTAGFRGALGDDFSPVGREEYVRLAMDSELLNPPGERYEYSNVGFSLLAAVVEQITDGSYDAFVQEKLFQPAGMTKTGYAPPRWDPDELAHGYRNGSDWGSMLDHEWADEGPYWHLRGNGGILSTVEDMYTWHRALEGDAVLSDEARRKYQAPHVPETEGGATYYGYGWSIAETRRGTLVAHNGGNQVFSNDFLRYVDDDVVIYLASNTSEHRAPRVARTIESIVFGEPYRLPTDPVETIGEEDLSNSPIGGRTLALLDVIGTKDKGKTLQFLEEHFHPHIFERYSRENLLEQFAGDQEDIGKVRIERIVKEHDFALELTVQSRGTGDWWRLKIRVDHEEPHQIISFGADDTFPPTEGSLAERENGWGLPDSPTGRASSAFLTAISKGDPEGYRDFIQNHLEPGFRDEFPMEDHLAQFRKIREVVGDFELVGVEKTGPHSAKLRLRSKGSGEYFRVGLQLSPRPPHLIGGLTVTADE